MENRCIAEVSGHCVLWVRGVEGNTWKNRMVPPKVSATILSTYPLGDSCQMLPQICYKLRPLLFLHWSVLRKLPGKMCNPGKAKGSTFSYHMLNHLCNERHSNVHPAILYCALSTEKHTPECCWQSHPVFQFLIIPKVVSGVRIP